MKRENGFRLILTAMFASMVCVSTLCIQISSPMGGYINLGDALVLISAFLLGPIYGAAAAGIGSALADLITGYAYYAPGTLVIKALVAIVAAVLLRPLNRHCGKLAQPLRLSLAAIPAELCMVLGYLAYAWICLSHGSSAVASVPGNLVQAAAGIAIAAFLTPLISKPKEIRELLGKFHQKT